MDVVPGSSTASPSPSASATATPLPVDEALRVVRDVASALAAAGVATLVQTAEGHARIVALRQRAGLDPRSVFSTRTPPSPGSSAATRERAAWRPG